MNPVPVSVKAPKFPQVNLIPPEVGQRRIRGRQRVIALALLLLFVAVLGAGGFVVYMARVVAEREVAAAEQRHAELTAEAATYAEVPAVEAQLANAVDARAYAGATEVIYSDLYEYISLALPEGMSMESVTISKATLTSVAGAETGPFAGADIGALTFVARTATAVDPAVLIEELSRVPFFSNIRISTTVLTSEESVTEGGVGTPVVYYSVQGTIRLTYDALSGRFAPEVGEFVPEPEPSVDPSASPTPSPTSSPGEA